MKLSGLMISHTLITTRRLIALSLCGAGAKPHTARISWDVLDSADQSPVASQESRYLYYCELMVDHVQKHNWYESINLNCCWASRSSARRMAEDHTGKHTTSNGQHQTWISQHRWGIPEDMLIINRRLNRFLELSLFVCEIWCILSMR